MVAEALRLYLIADPDHCTGDLAATVASAIAGGVTAVQLRAKSLTDREQLALARSLNAVCREASIPFLVNDRLDVALASGADGVHVGVDDLSVSDIRQLVSPGFLIGYSPEMDEHIVGASESGADYLGIGPVFGSLTKTDAGDALGIEEFRRRCTLAQLPVVGIGGINAGNAADVTRCGSAGVAVVSAILGARDPEKAARDLAHQSGV